MLAGKPVITCTDSGGTAELVRDGVNGLVVEPTPEALARGDRPAVGATGARRGGWARRRWSGRAR